MIHKANFWLEIWLEIFYSGKKKKFINFLVVVQLIFALNYQGPDSKGKFLA